MADNVKLLEEVLSTLIGRRTYIEREYDELEEVPPAPNDPNGQHDAMIKQGLCKAACANVPKNRYSNLYPFDSHIVHLHDGAYINASWIDSEQQKYIVTMAPVHPSSYTYGEPDNTCPDFWQMCWENNAKVVVMMCNIGPDFSGCSQYFPAMETEVVVHGLYSVKNMSSKSREGYVERKFNITSEKGEIKSIYHLQYTEWPNYGVPFNVESIANFIKFVYERAKVIHDGDLAVSSSQSSPYLLVHCSGGVGRSGTFLAMFIIYSQLHDMVNKRCSISPNTISIKTTVLRMRKQRHPWMVEGLHQYKLIYDVIIYLLKGLISAICE